MATPVYFTPGTLPEDYCFTTPQQFYNDIINNLIGEIPGNYNSFNFGNDVPDPADQDKPWIRTDGYGNFDRVYTYNGAWVSPHPVPASADERRIWVGTENSAWAYDGGDGTDPGTNPPTDTTGAMWEVDHDFDFRFPVGVGTNTVSYDGDAATTITLGEEGGEERVDVLLENLPTDLTIPRQQIPVGSGDGDYLAHDDSDEEDIGVNRDAADDDVPGTGHSLANMPPFLGVYFIKRTARQYYTV